MDILSHFPNIAWCKPDWCFPSMGKESKILLRQCLDLPKLELCDDVDEIIQKSKVFPVPFPIETVRLEKLKARRPVEKLRSNIVSTYPIIHERLLMLMTQFLIYKRKFGTSIEKALYKNMTVAELIDRILNKRAICFLSMVDHYKLISGEEDFDGWESVGSLEQETPLLLENCLSYDEIKLSALVYVSGPTECINDGTRRNAGVVAEGGAERDAVIIGVVGPRFKRTGRMEYEDILITDRQNCTENGYGEEVTSCLDVLKTSTMKSNQLAKRMWRQMWAEFYQVPSNSYAELKSQITSQEQPAEARCVDRYVKMRLGRGIALFDNEVYYKRLCVTAECVLLEAEARARGAGRAAFLNVIGAGLGVWMESSHQRDVYLLSFLERIQAFLEKDRLDHVTDINFAYIRPSESVLELFTKDASSVKNTPPSEKIFLESKRHPKGGINVQLESREPSAKLTGEHEGKLLVMTYPWDGNAHPGNEFWLGSLTTSGDPAAACSTQVAELHNAHINPAVSGLNVRVAGRSGVRSLPEYCELLTT